MEGKIVNHILFKPVKKKKYRLDLLNEIRKYGFDLIIEEISKVNPELKKEKIEDLLLEYLRL